MSGPTTRSSTSGIALRVGLVAVLLLAAVALGVVLDRLSERQAQSRDQVDRALTVVSTVRTIDGLEWRAVAGELTPELTARFEQTAEELRVLLRGLAPDADDELVAVGDRYLAAVDDMFVALEAGDAERARSIDEAAVDPGFEALLESAETVVADQRERARATAEAGTRLMWLSLGVVAGGFAALLFVSFGFHDARRTALLEATATRRLRSFVEGSPDVITIVSGDDDLGVLSPSLGVFEPFIGSHQPNRVADLLAEHDHRLWRTADDEVRAAGTVQHLDITLGSGTDRPAHIEGHGSPLVSDPTQRVWVWRDVTARRELEHQLNHQAFHDSLTGLANRALFHRTLDLALSSAADDGRAISVLYCDVDNFKAINDSLGHGTGDVFLKVITQRIRTMVRNRDTVARLGGDEFAVLLDDVDTEGALATAARVIDAVGAELELDGRTILPSVSIGVARADAGTTAERVLREADLAMYHAKRSGKGHAELYHHDVDGPGDGHDDLALQAELRSAIGTDQIRLCYQPTINLVDGTVEGVEALVRWNHPTRGPVPPDAFIPVAEATGLIIPLGRWILEQACRDAVVLQRTARHLTMAVNLSPVQLRDPHIVDQVQEALDLSGLAPGLLVLEVTEGTLLDDRRAIERLQALRAIGLRVALDDFGTGYTSITYLQGLPLDILKIDRSFISGDGLPAPERRALVATMIGLAKTLNLRSVAEGIEDESQLEGVAATGCDVGQGYLWSPARPLAEIVAVIDALRGQGSRVGGGGGRAGS